jgi:DNA replication protein DnaC
MKNLQEQLISLRLRHSACTIEEQLQTAIEKESSLSDFIKKIIQDEYLIKQQNSIERRIKNARIPVRKTFSQFDFSHPDKINKEQVSFLFNLTFIKNKENVIFCGGVGTGKTHLASTLSEAACQSHYNVIFTSAVDIINKLRAAQQTNKLERELRKYRNIQLLVIDELGYMPVDKNACDLLFQVISSRYEQASTIITTNRAYKDWPIIFNNDATVTSAILDRLLHHVHTIKIEGESYRMRD